MIGESAIEPVAKRKLMKAMDHLLRPMMRNQTGIGEWKMIRYLKESGRITGLVSKSTFFHDTKTLASSPNVPMVRLH